MSFKRLDVFPLVASCVWLLPLLPGSAGAQTEGAPQALDLGITAGATWSDNVALEPTNEQEGTIGQVALNVQYNQRSRRAKTDIDMNAAYEHYFDNEFDDDVVGGLNGTLVLGIAPERFEWFFQDNFGQTRVNVFNALTPDNRENVNYFSTGPEFTLRFGQNTSVRLSGRYSITDYELSDLSGDRYNAALAIIRQLSGSSSLSLNAKGERLEFDDAILNNEYDRYEGFLRYALGNERTDLGVDLGYTAIDDDAETSDGLLARLSLRRQTSPSGSITVNLGTEFSDAGNSFRNTQETQGVRLDPESVLATSDAFERRFALLGWDFSRNRTSFGINGEYSEENYENVFSLNRSIMRYAAYFGRQLTPGLRFRLDARFSNEDFETTDAKVDDLQGTVGLIWGSGRTLSWRLEYEYRDRSGSGPTAEYTENRASIFVTWSPLARR